MATGKNNEIKQLHHDGHGLNDRLILECDPKGAGGASHEYKARLDGALVAHVMFQHGAPGTKNSTPGMLDEAFLAIAIDRYEAFLEGPFACDETRKIHEHLTKALALMKKRADDRAARRVLQTSNK